MAIPPLIESDYAYQLMAADRLHGGQGYTSLQPVAPGQPWNWQYDWGFLSQWPSAYSLLVTVVRFVTATSTVEACSWISVFAVAFAALGWFIWLQAAVPTGLLGKLLALCGALCTVTPAMLVNPSTDALLVAFLPWTMLLALRIIQPGPATQTGTANSQGADGWNSWCLAWVGLLCGALFWIRYAALFVPAALAAVLLTAPAASLRQRFHRVLVFSVGAAVPVATLLIVNTLHAPFQDVQAQLNLGESVHLRLAPSLFAEAWMRWADLGYYRHIPAAHRILAALPVLVVLAALIPGNRGRTWRRFFAAPSARCSVAVLLAGLALIVAATAVFGEKFRYVGLDRYYLPLRPLYFALVLAPLLSILSPRPAQGEASGGVRLRSWATVCTKGAVAVCLLLALHWTIRQEWQRTLTRWRDARRQVTPYGQFERCFTPGSAELYRWLRARAAPDLIVFSNYHEYVALETGWPAYPIPPDMATLDDWMSRIARARRAETPQVLFVLDDDNRWRDYWIDAPEIIRERFNLAALPDAPPALRHWLFQPTGYDRTVSSRR